MSWFSNMISSTIGRKIIMSLTGLFLILFLIEHLIGNVLLITDFSGAAFNEYAHFMKESVFIIAGEVVLFAGFLFHIVDGLLLWKKNRESRPVKYYASNKSTTTSWTSKFMGPFGVIILVFFVVHLLDFFKYKYFPGDVVKNMAGTEIADMSALVYDKFNNPLYVAFYIIAMLVVAFHLHHGFQSSFQTLGVNHKKYTPAIKTIGAAYAIIVPLGLALIPLIIYINNIS